MTPGSDCDPVVWDIDGEDAVHSGEADDDAISRGQRATGEPGTGPSGDERDAATFRADADDRLNFLSRTG